MRINVYAEEVTPKVSIVEKTADTGSTFIGVRFHLASPETLHHSKKDDDTSAVTFWVKSSKAGFKHGDEALLLSVLNEAHRLLTGRAK